LVKRSTKISYFLQGIQFCCSLTPTYKLKHKLSREKKTRKFTILHRLAAYYSSKW